MNWGQGITIFVLALTGIGFIHILIRKMKEITGIEAVDQAVSSQVAFGILMTIIITATLILLALAGSP